MKAQQAVRIGGKKAPRRAPPKKTSTVDHAARLQTSLTTNGYKTQPVPDVTNCSFISKTGMAVNYSSPNVSAIYHKDNQPIGYIIKGKGELLNGGPNGNSSADLSMLKDLLAKKGIDIESIMKRVESGDKAALEEVMEVLKVAESENPQETSPNACQDDHANGECSGHHEPQEKQE
ncbi:hypothetical protein NEFER03_0566 [Nematocida sp. LUAm3]|nr:hypothetical protein NEFER03_0566 [Nematocida sp. LUAm3]KAI5175533.1 hypothetical protein NEFER02_1439 [Nematocida sp. LUAm2]KAI5178437.1 hypothetical protein NEFER01_1584 [Nematocida sp. LUAm1]